MTDRNRSRRSVLRAAAAVGVGAVGVTGTASARPSYGFLCSVDVPSMFRKDGSPLDPDDVGAVDSNEPAHGIFTANGVGRWDCGCWSCDGYRLNLPFAVRWTTDAPRSAVGDVVLDIDVRTPHTDYEDVGWEFLLDSPTERYDKRQSYSGLVPRYEKADGRPGNVFRPTTVAMELDFSGSDVSDDRDTLRETVTFATPNEGLLGVENLLDTTETVYDSGASLADGTVRVDLGRLRKVTRLWAYSSTAAADMIDPDGLPEQAVVRGITGFKDPIEDRRAQEAWNTGEEYVVTMAGPTILRKS